MRYLWITLLAAGPWAAGAQPATRHVELQVSNHMRLQEVHFSIQQEKKRTSLTINTGPGAGVARMIMDPGANTATFLSEKAGARKTGMVVALDNFYAQAPNAGGRATARPTGRTRVIGQDTCTEWVADTAGRKTVLWLSKDSVFTYGEVLDLLTRKGGPAAGYVFNLVPVAGLDGFPVEIHVYPAANPADSTTAVFSGLSAGQPHPEAFDTKGYEIYDTR